MLSKRPEFLSLQNLVLDSLKQPGPFVVGFLIEQVKYRGVTGYTGSEPLAFSTTTEFEELRDYFANLQAFCEQGNPLIPKLKTISN